MNDTCKGTVGDSFVACGEEPALYGYCSSACEASAATAMPPQRRRHPPDDHDAVLSTLPPGQMLRNSVGVVATAQQFKENYHDAPGRFYVDGSKVYCRGEEPDAAYTIVDGNVDDNSAT